ncbi:MAG: BrnA antitoxin family protein [Candidatus Symbiodolus clandestinus]
MSRILVRPTDKENIAITKAAMSDVDAIPLTDQEWESAKLTFNRGRPKALIVKERITIRLSHDVVESFRATGQGWQTRMDGALKDWLKNHSASI